jgi:hypothetical protein
MKVLEEACLSENDILGKAVKGCTSSLVKRMLDGMSWLFRPTLGKAAVR